MALNLEAVTGGKLAITLAMSLDPRWTNVRFKNTKLATDLALEIAKDRAVTYLHSVVYDKLLEAWRRFVFVNGGRPTLAGLEADEWDSGMDDEIYAVFEPHAHLVSASWLGTVSDATPVDVDDCETFAGSFAQECWKQLTYQRTANQTLAGVGIMVDDIQAFVLSHSQTQGKPMNVHHILNKIILNFIPEDQLEAALDNASDDDAGLQASGAAALGITPVEAAQLAAVRAEGGSVIEGWMHVINTQNLQPVEEAGPAPAPVPLPPPPPTPTVLVPPSTASQPVVPPPPPQSGPASVAVSTVPPPPPQLVSGTVPPPPPSVNAAPVATQAPPPAPEPPKPRKRRSTLPDTPPPGTVPAEALVAIKAASGLKDEDFANKLGVSRPTFNNWLRGKGFCTPKPDERRAMLDLVDARLTELHNARRYLE